MHRCPCSTQGRRNGTTQMIKTCLKVGSPFEVETPLTYWFAIKLSVAAHTSSVQA